MPETRFERAIFVLGLLAMLALALVIARSWHHTTAAPAPPEAAKAQAPTAQRTAPEVSSTNDAADATPTEPTPAFKLSLTASRGATWIEVRAGSATGTVLYTGTLPYGTTKVFRDTAIWVRFGGATNLDVRLNGQRLRLPAGTYDAVFDNGGYHQVS